MTRIRIIVAAIAAMMAMPASQGAHALGPDTVAAARILVPLLKSVKQRWQPRLGVGPGPSSPSPFTGRQSTVVSVGVGKQEVPVDPKVSSAVDQLLSWKIGSADDSAATVLFDHWLEQLTVSAAAVGLRDCDSACLMARFPKPDGVFGRSRAQREQTRDQLLIDALTAAVDEIQPGR